MTEFWPEVSRDFYLARIAMDFFIEEIKKIEIQAQHEIDRIQQDDKFSVDVSETHSAILKFHSTSAGGQRDRSFSESPGTGGVNLWGARVKTGVIDGIINEELRVVELRNVNSLIHMFSEQQPALVEELLVDYTIFTFSSLCRRRDTNESDWFPVIACMKPLVSIPFQNFAFVERVLHKLYHLVILTVSHDGPRRKVFCAAAHSLLLSVVNVCILDVQHCFSTSQQTVELEAQLSDFVSKAPLFSSSLEPKVFETLVQFMKAAAKVCGPEVYATQRKLWFQMSFGEYN